MEDLTYYSAPYESKRPKLNSLRLNKMECCGWLQVSGFDYCLDEDSKEDLKTLMYNWNSKAGRWADNNYNIETILTLFCTLANQSRVKKELISMGWIELPRFYNPNSGNICTPLMFIPKELRLNV